VATSQTGKIVGIDDLIEAAKKVRIEMPNCTGCPGERHDCLFTKAKNAYVLRQDQFLGAKPWALENAGYCNFHPNDRTIANVNSLSNDFKWIFVKKNNLNHYMFFAFFQLEKYILGSINPNKSNFHAFGKW